MKHLTINFDMHIENEATNSHSSCRYRGKGKHAVAEFYKVLTAINTYQTYLTLKFKNDSDRINFTCTIKQDDGSIRFTNFDALCAWFDPDYQVGINDNLLQRLTNQNQNSMPRPARMDSVSSVPISVLPSAPISVVSPAPISVVPPAPMSVVSPSPITRIGPNTSINPNGFVPSGPTFNPPEEPVLFSFSEYSYSESRTSNSSTTSSKSSRKFGFFPK